MFKKAVGWVGAAAVAGACFGAAPAGSATGAVVVRPVNLAGTTITDTYEIGPDAPNVFQHRYTSASSVTLTALSGPAIAAGFVPTKVRYRAIRIAPQTIFVTWTFPKSFKFAPGAHESIVYDLKRHLSWNMGTSADPRMPTSIGTIKVRKR